jgi:hypothetical protein
LEYFENLTSLFSISTQIQINKSNVLVFEYISDILENEYLEAACRFVFKGKAPYQCLELASKMLQKGSTKIRKSLFDFIIFVNDEEIECNKAFCCCLSKAIFEVVSNDASITEYHFNDVHNKQTFVSLFGILDGDPFQSDCYSNREVIECFCQIGSNFEFPFDIQSYDDIVWFLLLPFSKNQTELYNKYIKIVASDFQNIPIDLLKKLSCSLLELVFNNHDFIRPNETFLFNLLIEDPSKHYLLKFINLWQLDISILKTFLEHI